MRYVLVTIVLIFVAFVDYSFAYNEHAEAMITLRAMDEQGLSIEGANAGVTFEEILWWDSKSIPFKGITGKDGLFSASRKTSREIYYGADKEGYYKSYGKYSFKEIIYGRWEPWNPVVTVVMRKKGNPVPMYARDTMISKVIIPVVGKEVGFDLIEFDWLPPYGKGKKSDMIFQLNGTYENVNNYDMILKIRFAGNFEGIQALRQDIRQGSMLKLLRLAPESGYQKEIVKYRKRQPDEAIKDNFDELNNYYFRVRAEEKDNKLIRAMYGKIHGDIKFYPKSVSTATIVFKYFLNPDYTRNMEFGSNLFGGLNIGTD